MHSGLLVLTVGAMALGAVVLGFSIKSLLALLRDAEVARVPGAVEQTVAFKEPGTYVLHVEQPRLNTALHSAGFSLRDARGSEVRSTAVIFHTTKSGFSTASISVRSFDVERAGSCRLVVSGVRADADLSRVELIFTRPYAAAMVLRILGIVVGAACLIGGLVFTALLYAGKL